MAIKKTITKKVLPKAQKGIIKDSIIKSSWTKKEPTPVYSFNKLDTTSLNNKFSNTMDDKSKSPKIKFKEGGSTPAWTRKEGKSPSGGLNAKGRASLKAAGHDIKAPQPEGGPRKKSFCARMEGMKKKLTSAKTAKDPNSRINKSLRKWNC